MIDTNSPAFKAACRGFARGLAEDKTLGDILTTALEAYLAAMPKDEWLPIETAREQTGKFLVWDAHYGIRIGCVHVRPTHDDWLSYCDARDGSSKGGIRATHWRPLPTPPETQA
jgi:hypothetical protein